MKITLSFFLLGWIALPILAAPVPENFRRENLVAWCIVPFDAAKRGPEARAAMVNALGLRTVAYDWRKEQVPTFEAELAAYEKFQIRMFAFWSGHEEAYPLFRSFGVEPQIWKTLRSNDGSTPEARVALAVSEMEPLASRLRDEGLTLGLYNHGGWGGEPANLVAVCQALQARGYSKVGIVYNFHHAHDRIDQWAEDLALMKPHLLCLNLNGMVKGGPEKGMKILEIGEGDQEQAMIAEIIKADYTGPIGILDHRNETDSAETLTRNLEGLATVLDRILADG